VETSAITGGRALARPAATLLLALIVGLGLMVVVSPPTEAAAARPAHAGPVAQLHLDAQAFEGPRGTILAGLRGRCAPGYEVADLVLDFAQGDVTTPPVLGQPFPCDGRWHRQRVTSLEAFTPGRATLTARLSVVRQDTGDPGPQAVATKAIYVRPAAKIVLPRAVHLGAQGVVTAVVRARCDAPWVLQEFYVSASQGTTAGSAFGEALLDLRCDGVVRPVKVRLRPVAAPFRRGTLVLDAAITLLDPETFDPVTQARASRTVRVR
jgi:hypothetical protein